MPSLSNFFTAASTRTKQSKSTADRKAQPGRRAASSSSSSTARQKAARHQVSYDVTYGPPPPRGSVTKEKLCYLDWRLSHIRDSRLSEHTDAPWVDGRNTIGRTSFEIHAIAAEQDGEESSESLNSSSGHKQGGNDGGAPQEVAQSRAQDAIIAIYSEEEKAAGSAALKHALMVDNALVTVPLLGKVESRSESDSSSSDDNHHRRGADNHGARAGQTEAAPAVKAARPTSIFHRASRKISLRGKRTKPAQDAVAANSIDRRTTLRGRVLPIRLWQS